MDISEIGRRIRHARQRLGLTQAHVADRSGISRTTYTRLERGRLPEIGFGKMTAILEVVGIKLSLEEKASTPKQDAPSLTNVVDAYNKDPKRRARTRRQLRDVEHLILVPSGLSADGIAKILTTLKGKSVAASARTGTTASSQQGTNNRATKPTLNELLQRRAMERRDRSSSVGSR